MCPPLLQLPSTKERKRKASFLFDGLKTGGQALLFRVWCVPPFSFPICQATIYLGWRAVWRSHPNLLFSPDDDESHCSNQQSFDLLSSRLTLLPESYRPPEGRSASQRISPTHFVLDPFTSPISSPSRPSSLDNFPRKKRRTEGSCRRLFCPVSDYLAESSIFARDDGRLLPPGIIRCLSYWDKTLGTGLRAAHMQLISSNTG